jgi:cytochrome P450
VERIVANTLDRLPAAGEVDLYESYARSVPSSVVLAFMGLPESLWQDLQDWTDVIAERMPEPLIDLPEMARRSSAKWKPSRT